MDDLFDPGSLGGDGIPFIFVPRGDPEPVEWMALYPGWVKFPATFVPHPPATTRPKPIPPVPAAVVGSAAAALGPDISMNTLWLATTSVEGVLAGAAASLAAVGILLYPSSTASPAMDEDSPLLPRRRKPAHEALVPPALTPAPTGLVPPPDGRSKGGFTPAPPTPPLPGFTPAPPQSAVPAGPDGRAGEASRC